MGQARQAQLEQGLGHQQALFVLGAPAMSVFAFGSRTQDVFAVGDAMDARGWHLDRQRDPDALHLMLSPEHDRVADAFLADLREAVAAGGTARSREARYT